VEEEEKRKLGVPRGSSAESGKESQHHCTGDLEDVAREASYVQCMADDDVHRIDLGKRESVSNSETSLLFRHP
jgi:hypothetical protein